MKLFKALQDKFSKNPPAGSYHAMYGGETFTVTIRDERWREGLGLLEREGVIEFYVELIGAKGTTVSTRQQVIEEVEAE